MTTQTLGRSRHLRLNPLQDDALQRIARSQGCSVSDLLRRAAIQVFSLPTEDTIGGDVPHITTDAVDLEIVPGVTTEAPSSAEAALASGT